MRVHNRIVRHKAEVQSKSQRGKLLRDMSWAPFACELYSGGFRYHQAQNPPPPWGLCKGGWGGFQRGREGAHFGEPSGFSTTQLLFGGLDNPPPPRPKTAGMGGLGKGLN